MPGLPVVGPLQNHAGGGGQNIHFQTKTNWFFIINYERIYLCSGITCFISNLIFQKVVFLFCSHLHINYSGFFDKSSDRKTS